jgi:LysM repeat protein
MYADSMGVFYYTIQPFDSFWTLAQRFNTSVEEICATNPGVNPYYLFVGQIISVPNYSRNFQFAQAPHCISESEFEFKNNMRSLWEQHIAWTRMTIISLVFHLPDVDFVVARLLQNATDMENLLRPYYGDNIAQRYSNLIKEHLLIAADLVKAAMAGNQAKVAEVDRKWHANADEIAVFLRSINPYLTAEDVRKMFYDHLALTTTEAVSMIRKDYKTGVEVFDKIEKQALEMADAISDAIVRQFPSMFL